MTFLSTVHCSGANTENPNYTVEPGLTLADFPALFFIQIPKDENKSQSSRAIFYIARPGPDENKGGWWVHQPAPALMGEVEMEARGGCKG